MCLEASECTGVARWFASSPPATIASCHTRTWQAWKKGKGKLTKPAFRSYDGTVHCKIHMFFEVLISAKFYIHTAVYVYDKKTLYLIKTITAFSFFKLSYPEGQLGWVLFFPPAWLLLPSLSLSLSISLSLSSSLSLSLSFAHSTVAQWTAPTAISHHYHLPSWASASHYHAALLIFLSYQLANHKPLSLMAQFGVRRYSFCRST